MKKLLLMKTVLLLFALVVGSGSVWATESTVTASKITSSSASWTGSQNETWSVSVNGGATNQNVTNGYAQVGTRNSPSTSITFSTSGISGTITKIVVDCASYSGLGTISATVGGSAFGTQNQSIPSWSSSTGGDKTFSGSASGAIVITMTNGSGGRAMYIKSISVTYTTGGGGGSDPSISANNVNIADNATSGSIAYTLENATGNVSATIASGNWLTLGTITSSAVPFTCSANTGTERTATVTLSFTGATDKVVTITQAAKTVDTPTYNVQSNGNYLAGMGIVLTSEGNTIYYNMTTDGSTPADPDQNSTEYKVPIALPEGTVKFAAIAYDSYGNKSTVSNRTCIGVAPATLPFNWEGGIKSNLLNKGGVVDNGLGTDYADSKYGVYKLKFDSDGDNILIFTNEQPVKVCVGALLNGNSTSTIKIQESPDGIAYTDVQSFDVSGKQYDVTNIETTNPFTSTTRVIKILFVKSGSNIGVGPISINLAKANLNASGYATFASTYPIDFSDDSEFSAWQITGVTGNTITFSQITGTVAASTGVLLKGTASTAANIHLVAAGTDISSTNKLVGITTATDVVADTYYGLSGNQFKKVGAGKVPAGKALLPASEVAGARELTFVFDEATGIKQVETSKSIIEGIYNLAGQKVQNPTKGLYIMNGKKVIIK